MRRVANCMRSVPFFTLVFSGSRCSKVRGKINEMVDESGQFHAIPSRPVANLRPLFSWSGPPCLVDSTSTVNHVPY